MAKSKFELLREKVESNRIAMEWKEKILSEIENREFPNNELSDGIIKVTIEKLIEFSESPNDTDINFFAEIMATIIDEEIEQQTYNSKAVESAIEQIENYLKIKQS